MAKTKKRMPKAKTFWGIFKRFRKQPWPGDFWDGEFKSLRTARRAIKDYNPDPHSVFIIVRMRYTQVPPK